ncbi:MAG: hypothetical protein IKX47_00680, partial [Oscillospiraceae bacterium]|nr:hypothetical protein [Oscillospiraceae bacterium]
MKRTTRLIPAILLLLSLIVGCGNHQTSLPADAETPAVTQRPAATAVPAATEKPAAGEAPSATEEPQPEPEPEPAAMPEPEPEQDDLNLRRTAVNAYLDREQNAFIPCSDGSCIKIEDEAGVRMACLSPDEEQIVYITGDGMLYLTD